MSNKSCNCQTHQLSPQERAEVIDRAIDATNAELREHGGRPLSSLFCDPDCRHSDLEHEAFDTGLKAGEAGDDDYPWPSRYVESGELVAAWLSGHSIGALNRVHLEAAKGE